MYDGKKSNKGSNVWLNNKDKEAVTKSSQSYKIMYVCR